MRPYHVALLLPDPHVPHHDRRAWRSLLRYVAEEDWSHVVCLGDLMDFAGISRWLQGSVKERMEQLPIPDTYDAADGWWRDVEKAAPKAHKVYVQGNHDWRVAAYADSHPELGRWADVPEMLRLRQRGIEWVPFWERGNLYRLGKAMIGHGRLASVNHSRANALQYASNLFYGHTHDIQEHSIKLAGKGKAITAVSCGCLCDLEMPYLQGRPTNWQHAFAVLWLWPDGGFQHTVTRITGGRFIGPTNGKVYGG